MRPHFVSFGSNPAVRLILGRWQAYLDTHIFQFKMSYETDNYNLVLNMLFIRNL